MKTLTTLIPKSLSLGLVLALSTATTFVFVACGSKSGDSTATPPPVTTVLPDGTAAVRCPSVTQVYVPGHNCLTACSDHPGYGWDPTSGMCLPGQTLSANVPGSYSGSASVNSAQFAKVLVNLGKCGGDWNGVSGSFGSANCSSYSGSATVTLQTSGTGTVMVVIAAGGSSFNSNSPVSIQGAGIAQPYNSNQGMIINLGSGVSLVIDGATLSASTLNAHLKYQATEFGTVVLNRYQ
jgi:hypothetical protein